jgi:hypothetical protein
MMFLISEVHPFADGNGRVARIMMNAELVAAGENRIIVPTIYRNNYLMALKALSQNKITAALPRTMDFAQRYTAAVDFAEMERARFYPGTNACFHGPERGRRGRHPFDFAHARDSRRSAVLMIQFGAGRGSPCLTCAARPIWPAGTAACNPGPRPWSPCPTC